MANINISFDNKKYPILETTLSAALANFYQHLTTKMNGNGAKIELDNQLCDIDATKLSTATNTFVDYLDAIAGNGSKIVVGGVEYNIDPTKVADAIADLHTAFNTLSSGSEDPSSGGVDPETGEILDSWDQIIAAVNDGTYSTKYAVGNYKSLDLGSEGVVIMQIAAFDADTLSDESGNAHITWIAGTLLANRYIMKDGATNNNGWAECDMRNYLANNIWALIPSNVQNSIVEVYKSYYDYTTGSTLYCADKLWLPSYREVGIGEDAEEYGAIYDELFTDQDSRIRTLNGNPEYWWLRSAPLKGSTYFYAISNNGGYARYYSNSTYHILLGFCM